MNRWVRTVCDGCGIDSGRRKEGTTVSRLGLHLSMSGTGSVSRTWRLGRSRSYRKDFLFRLSSEEVNFTGVPKGDGNLLKGYGLGLWVWSSLSPYIRIPILVISGQRSSLWSGWKRSSLVKTPIVWTRTESKESSCHSDWGGYVSQRPTNFIVYLSRL